MIVQFIGDGGAEPTVDVSVVEEMGRRTEGYSGADIELVVREAKMERMRCMLKEVDVEELMRGLGGSGEGAEAEGGKGGEARVRPQDLFGAMDRVKRTVRGESLAEFEKWNDKFGGGMGK